MGLALGHSKVGAEGVLRGNSFERTGLKCLGQARERKDPAGSQLAHPAAEGSCMMDGFHGDNGRP